MGSLRIFFITVNNKYRWAYFRMRKNVSGEQGRGLVERESGLVHDVTCGTCYDLIFCQLQPAHKVSLTILDAYCNLTYFHNKARSNVPEGSEKALLICSFIHSLFNHVLWSKPFTMTNTPRCDYCHFILYVHLSNDTVQFVPCIYNK